MSLELLKNPFSSNPVKLQDGKVQRSSAVKLSASGVLDIPPNVVLEIFLIPTVLNTLSVALSSPVFNTVQASAVPSDHVIKYDAYPGSGFFFPVVKNATSHRIVSSGARFRLLNTDTFSDDGYWEAVRLPASIPFQTSIDYQGSYSGPELHLCTYNGSETIKFSNVESYQSGKLRDLENYTFKLNYENLDELYGGLGSSITKPDFDVIMLRLTGRQDGLSKVSWRTVCNQEIVYKPGSNLSKFHTPCDVDPYFAYTMAQTREFYPGVLDGGGK